MNRGSGAAYPSLRSVQPSRTRGPSCGSRTPVSYSRATPEGKRQRRALFRWQGMEVRRTGHTRCLRTYEARYRLSRSGVGEPSQIQITSQLEPARNSAAWTLPRLCQQSVGVRTLLSPSQPAVGFPSFPFHNALAVLDYPRPFIHRSPQIPRPTDTKRCLLK